MSGARRMNEDPEVGESRSSNKSRKKARLDSKRLENELIHEQQRSLLQEYRDVEVETMKNRVEMTKTGDINIAMHELDKANELYSKAKETSDNTIYAEDSKVMVNVSELAHLSVKNLKLGDTRGFINVNDILNGCKSFMLKDYFKQNDISEPVLKDLDGHDEEDDDNGDGVSSNNTANDKAALRVRNSANRHNFLAQFEKYDQFEQFNWFKMGMLYDSLSKNVQTTDHFFGPFSIEAKVRLYTQTNRDDGKVGKLATAEKVTKSASKSDDKGSTATNVQYCYTTLEKKSPFPTRISLFEFFLDPNSFAKSVENLFYTSFLIKEGKIVLEEDENNLPVIQIKEKLPSDRTQKNIESQQRRQASVNHIIFQLDKPTWSKLIKKFKVKKSYL
ncbi:hypothetical protein Kpol_526p8 [Vanderwaltozyma polyspora DSM 70294]|uniref:Non-structural maintenance of chromosomes element 4 n=1 Tax=Vanderwaltozyma polyspora (strain ATCC 22028 / DSM 70294 / BCRC 21397 / CBS 2163 / NBRC 10782 / NRRL Y-8283 / UCD 57-17) TaxID=436907 RepID=A7TLR3_VANPO|nr:uncharacterized protein Kpol_526p8 [Vanderwaltozyma polyspora DSM 70294]EDO16755.1 hypothetical protein Kpol_526p8 [Vanderwaltozyma polyspora DSM 70294]